MVNRIDCPLHDPSSMVCERWSLNSINRCLPLADGVDMLLLSHGELIATVYEIKMPKKMMKKNVEPAEIEEGKVNIGPELRFINQMKNNFLIFFNLTVDECEVSCDGMKGYLSPCSGETRPLIFRCPVKGMEGILTNQLM
ncbi:BnaC09g09280D [Brassica napus]|uniref:BnaC09g09280D protein n=1 Tax=Brassica napus TaxID=3708 RepID=A0A078GN82_BRANA|nr:BnaC09g09280D [Brassica napus]